MRKPRKGIVERFLRHLILSRDFHTSLMLALSVGSVTGEHDTLAAWLPTAVFLTAPGGGGAYPPQASRLHIRRLMRCFFSCRG